MLLTILIARGIGIIPVFVFSGSAPPGYYDVDIQGAKVVSEGGYFNFYIRNNSTGNLTVTFLNYTGSEVFLQPDDTVTYKIIAPEIYLPYQNVSYVFAIRLFLTENHSEAVQWALNNAELGNLIVDDKGVLKEYIYAVVIVKADLVQRYTELERQLRLYIPLLMITVGICLFIGTSYVVEQFWKFIQIVKQGRRK
jgi:hypothetical protein